MYVNVILGICIGGGIHQSIGDDDKLHDLEYPMTLYFDYIHTSR